MTIGTPGARRAAVAVLAVLLLPACGKGIRVSPSLFSEGFNGAFPGTAWTAVSTTGAAPAVTLDGATGFPAPSLEMTTAAPTGTARTETVTAFSNPNLTVSVHMAAQSAAATELGTARVAILDATPAVVATATWDNATNLITFQILGSATPSAVVTRDSTFYRVVFNVNSAGTATWSFNGGAPVVTQAAFPAGMLKVELSSSFGAGAAWPFFFFDNVNVTSP